MCDGRVALIMRTGIVSSLVLLFLLLYTGTLHFADAVFFVSSFRQAPEQWAVLMARVKELEKRVEDRQHQHLSGVSIDALEDENKSLLEM